jgi:hypothetical protein
MDNVIELKSTYTIKYTNKDPLPIQSVIDSLNSLEKILARTPRVMEKMIPGLSIVEADFFVSAIETGSLKDQFLVKLIIKNPETREKIDDVLASILDGDEAVLKTLLALAVGGVIGWGVHQAISGSGMPTTKIDAHNSVIFNSGGSINVSPKAFESAVRSISNPKALAKEAVLALSPAKLDPEASIETLGIPADIRITMPSEVIKSSPETYDPPKPKEKFVNYKNINIFISASDKDHHDKGWAGVINDIDEVTSNRIKLELSDEIDLKLVYGRLKISADIEIMQKFNQRSKKYETKEILIEKVHPILSSTTK